MRLGRKPVAIATTASIVTTRMAAANISTSFGMAQSPRWLAPCAKYAPRCNATCIKAVWLAEPRQGRADPAALAVTRCEGRRIGIMVTAKNTVTERAAVIEGSEPLARSLPPPRPSEPRPAAAGPGRL